MTAQTLYTIGQLAKRFGVAVRRIEYAVTAYGITESRRIGIVRVWDEAGALQIRSALIRIAGNSNKPREALLA